MAGKTKSQKKKALDMRSKMYLVLALCSVMLLVSVGISLVLIGGIDLGGADAQSVSTVDSASMVVESGYDKEENTIDTQAYTSTILEQSADAGDSYVDETLFLGDSNTARMYRMFDYCSYDNAIGSVGMTAKSLVTFACVQVSTSSGYITMPQAVAKLQPRRVILTFGTNDLNPGYKAADFVKNYRTGIEAIVTAYPSVDIIVNAIPPIGQQHSNQSLTQTQVDEYNKALVEMCQEKDWKFLNSAEVLKDSVTGYAKSGYVETSDGIHLTRTAMDALFNYIRTHSYITEDDRPALTTIPKHTGDKDAVVYTVPVVSSSSTATATSPVTVPICLSPQRAQAPEQAQGVRPVDTASALLWQNPHDFRWVHPAHTEYWMYRSDPAAIHRHIAAPWRTGPNPYCRGSGTAHGSDNAKSSSRHLPEQSRSPACPRATPPCTSFRPRYYWSAIHDSPV